MRCFIYTFFIVLSLSFSSITFGQDNNNNILVMKILQCESNFRSNVYGDGGKAYGIAQFHKKTFYYFAEKAKPAMKKAGYWPPIYKNASHQVFLLSWAIKTNYKPNSWTCYTKITRGNY